MEDESKVLPALAKLRNDLEILRNQDITLMKQLIEINHKIRILSRQRPVQSNINMFRPTDGCFASITDMTVYELSSESDDDNEDEMLFDTSTVPRTFTAKHRFCHGTLQRPKMNNNINYGDILRRNIRLWKHSKSISNDSLNSLVSSDNHLSNVSLKT